MKKNFAILCLLIGCAGQARPIEEPEANESKLENLPVGDGEWSYVAIRDDRDFDELAPITGGSHDPKEMPAGKIGTPSNEDGQPAEEKMRIKKCNTDADCPDRACLRPAGGPHPFGVCGESVDYLGRPTSNRVVASCGIAAQCPGGGKCVLAYGDYGMCFK